MARNFSNTDVWSRGAAIGIALLLGVSILWLGVPRLVAAFLLLPGDGTVKRIQAKMPVTEKKLAELVSSRENALEWVTSGRLRTDLALGRLMLGRGEGQIPSSQINQSIRDLKAGLAVAPANPYAWARLAVAEQLAGGPSTSVASALVMSVVTGPYEPDLIPLRLDLGFQNWRHLSSRDRDLVRQQIRFGWVRSKKRILEMSRDPRSLAIIRAALVRNPGSLAAFEKGRSRPSR